MATPFTPAELQAAEDAIRTRSFLRPATELTPQRIDGIINTTILTTVAMARRELGDIELNVRALLAHDFGALTDPDNNWLETTGGTGWADSAFANGSQVPDNTFLGIYGARYMFDEDADGLIGGFDPVVDALRLSIGGSRVAQWDLNVLYKAAAQVATQANVWGPLLDHKSGIVESPIIVTQNKTVTVQFLERATTLDFAVMILGVTVEPVGQGAGLNP